MAEEPVSVSMAEHSDLQGRLGRDGPGASRTEQSTRVPLVPRTQGDAARTVNAWREQWRQLGLQAWSAESDSRRETQNARALNQEQLEDLRSTLKKAEDDFRVWDRSLWGGLAKVRKRIHVLARNIQFAPKQGDIRRMVQASEHDLRIFAEQTRQEEDELAALECSLQDTLESSLARFEGWCSQESSLRKPPENASRPSRPPSCSRSRQVDTASSKEAKQLDSMHEELDKMAADIAADGGSTGGWSCDDHDTFLRVFNKFKRRTGVEFMAEVQQLLPDKRHEDLVAHISWLLTYEDRQLEKRQLVEKWRCMRAVASGKEAPTTPKQELSAAAAQDEKRQRACSRERIQKELSEQRQRVAEWRHARNEEERARQDQQQRRADEAKAQEACERRRQSEQKRQALEAMREQRTADEALIGKGARKPASPSATAAHPVSLEERKRIADRNAALLQRRASQVQAKQQRFEPPVRASSVGAVKAYRHVESRLDEHTKAYVDQSRELREAESILDQSASKYGVIPGNFAHQGVVRTMRKSASWRPHFGA